MKAIVQKEYGSSEKLKLKDVDKPHVEDDQVLVRINTASVNALDWHFMRGTPRFGRLVMGLRKPKNSILGADMAGRVEAVGENVTQFRPGDEVVGDAFEHGLGAFADYACAPEKAFVLKPRGTSKFTVDSSLKFSGKTKSSRVYIDGDSRRNVPHRVTPTRKS